MSVKRRNKVDPTFSMSSLTDVIFLLLIFFMLTSNLVTSNKLALDLPESNSQTVAPANVSVSIDKAGSYYVDTDKVSVVNLKSAIENKLNDLQIKGELNVEEGKKPRVVLNVESGTESHYIRDVIIAAQKLRLDVLLATKPSTK